MPQGKEFTAEQIIGMLWEAEVELSRDRKVPEMSRKTGVTEQTYYRWKKECGDPPLSRMTIARNCRRLQSIATIARHQVNWKSLTSVKTELHSAPVKTAVESVL